jgi:ureidoglycolate lyase
MRRVTGRRILLQPPDAAAFAPYGRFILPPDRPGRRAFYSDSLQAHPPGSAPVLHVNHVPPSELPLTVTGLERHPYAAQCFVPLDVARYAVLVMPSDAAGVPVPERALAFLVPGTIGVIYHPDVWHLGATVLDRPGHFTVLMWRGGADPDDVFRTVEPMTLALPEPRHDVDHLAQDEVAP